MRPPDRPLSSAGPCCWRRWTRRGSVARSSRTRRAASSPSLHGSRRSEPTAARGPGDRGPRLIPHKRVPELLGQAIPQADRLATHTLGLLSRSAARTLRLSERDPRSVGLLKDVCPSGMYAETLHSNLTPG